jgi:epoxyqueuosine reductase
LVSLLIDQKPINKFGPIEKSKCGKCTVCMDKCPAHAANGKLWNIKVHRDEFFDVWKCRNKCAELAKVMLHLDERICGLCVNVCPFGKRK